MRFPVYIPSKGRPGVARTPKVLDRDGVPFRIVVEPSEFSSYADAYGASRVLELPKDGQGLIYSRNFCKRHAIAEGHAWHWQIDDDVTTFRKRTAVVGGKPKYGNALAGEVLAALEDLGTSYTNVAAVCPQSLATIFGKIEDAYNQLMYTCVLFRSDVGAWWRVSPEDTDYTLQLLTLGWVTILSRKYAHNAVPTGTQAGGMESSRAGQGARLVALKNLRKLWPSHIRIVERNTFGHPSGTTRWSNFRQRPVKILT